MGQANTLEDLEASLALQGVAPAVYVGIDTGVYGAIAIKLADRRQPLVLDMPVTKVTTGTGKRAKTHSEYVTPEIARIVRALSRCAEQVSIVVEFAQPHQKDGKFTWRLNGVALGMWTTVFSYAGLSYEFVQPGDWKAEFGLIKKDKNASRQAALRIWPHAPCTLVKEDGRAEALLLAEWLRRRHTGSLTVRGAAKSKAKAKPAPPLAEPGDASLPPRPRRPAPQVAHD